MNLRSLLFGCLALVGILSLRATSSAVGPEGVVDTGGGPWNLAPQPMPVLPMDRMTVFAFSQSNCSQSDPQVLELAPDCLMRAWQRWDREGTRASDYDFNYVKAVQAAGIKFIGGTTATVLFEDELPHEVFQRIVTRNARGEIVRHDNLVPGAHGAHRGSLASPEYREYLEAICRLQIDGGVDGLFFDEIDHDYDGERYDNDEGFDAFHLADFNAYLLAKYPTETDFARRFRMTADNCLRRDIPAGDLRRNFNYLRYLEQHGWSRDPFAAANPLAAEWGRAYDDQPEPGAKTFVSAAEPYRYFGQMVRRLKAYAREKYGRDLLITANGNLPNVDFQSFGLWDHNRNGDDGAEVNYVPLKRGHLDGRVSLQPVFQRIRARSELLSPGASVVLFLDWPTPTLNRYVALPQTERMDFWRIYAAEAYANGLFFAFHLRTTTGEPTATAQGMMPFFKQYTAFYRTHADLFHDLSAPAAATKLSVSESRIMTASWEQPKRHRLLLHLVNHDYERGLKPRHKLTLEVPVQSRPQTVTVASPDLSNDEPVTYDFSGGKLKLTLPELVAYSIVIVDY